MDRHLSALENILQDCKTSLVEFETILDEIKKGRFSSAFFRKSTMAWKIDQKTPQLGRIQHLVSGYHRAMQIHLQLMNLLLATQTAAGIQDVDSSLDGIKSEILRLRFHLTSLNERDDLAGQTLTSNSIKQSLATSEHVLTDASEYLGSTAGTIRPSNTSTVNFSADRAAQVEEWVLLEDENEGTGNSSAEDGQYASDEDPEMISELGALAETHYAKGDYQNAKRFFIAFLSKMSTSPTQSESEVVAARMKLTLCHVIQEEYEEAFSVLDAVDLDHCRDEQIYSIRQNQAEVLYMGKNFEKAKQHAKLAMKTPGGRKKGSDEYNNSVTLLSLICDNLGQHEEAEVYKARVPSSFQPKRIFGWKPPRMDEVQENSSTRREAIVETATTIPPGVATREILEPLVAEFPSGRTSTPTSITFINCTKSTRISVYWIDWNSTAKHYVDVDAGISNLRPTYVEHVWRVIDSESGRLIGSYVAKSNDASVIITDEMELKPLVQNEVPSGRSSSTMVLTFVNESSRKVKLYWIDASGNAKFYDEIEPLHRSVRPTYASHVWRVCDMAGRKIASYVAPLGDSTVFIRNTQMAL